MYYEIEICLRDDNHSRLFTSQVRITEDMVAQSREDILKIATLQLLEKFENDLKKENIHEHAKRETDY